MDDVRTVMLTNILPRYRQGDYEALRAYVPSLVILLSRPTVDENLAGVGGQQTSLDVRYMRSLSLRHGRRHPSGFSQDTTVFFPYDLLAHLYRLRPSVVISTELGLRTMQAALYTRLARNVRLIIHADLSEHTEAGRGCMRTAARRLLLAQADAVIVNGQGGKRYVKAMGVPEQRIFESPYSTAGEYYSEVVKVPGIPERRRLLYVGQFVPRKGLLPFVHALSDWCAAHSQITVELTLIGAGPQREALISSHRPGNLVLEVRPPERHAALVQQYARADIFVLPTLADTWGLVVNEAMLSAVPVLGSLHSQAVEELVDDGVSGWRFDPTSPEGMRTAIDAALKTPLDRVQEMGRRARDNASLITPSYVAERFAHCIEFARLHPRRSR